MTEKKDNKFRVFEVEADDRDGLKEVLKEIMKSVEGEQVKKVGGKYDASTPELDAELFKKKRADVQELVDTILHGSGVDGAFDSDQEAQAAALAYFAKQAEMPKVGQLVERNEYGMRNYKYPKAGLNVSAVVVEVYGQYRCDTGCHGKPVNGVIAMVGNDGTVALHPVDLRQYKAVEVKKVN